MANRQDLDVFAGEDRTLSLAARNASNAPVNLTGSTVAWYVGGDPRWPCDAYPVITKAATLTTPASGLFSVSLDPSDTRYRYGEYVHEARATDGSGNITIVCKGRLFIRSTMVP